ncbi:MAG TPA: SDR family oxidoreductase [Flavihumibacter sp.]|nr:SDR family oxidoreductase [Flavihumibacter sp.]HPZ89131.1 SDR family oxidoreductase [Flavihumibacter sp.]HQD10089.1 SDR family oxidoreductase [Flavihumibacter sp.]
MDLSLKGKKALVCGSSQGIGLAVAQELASLGAQCVLLARNEDRLKAALQTLAVTDQPHQYAVADFSDPNTVRKAVTPLVQAGDFHVLINNTGGPAPGPLVEAPADAFENAFRQHVVINQLLAQLLLPGMIKQKYGRIVNIVSTSVKVPLPALGVSNTIRAAVASWAKSLSNEVAVHGITVNNVLPGYTSTARLDQLTAVLAEKKGISVAEQMNIMAESVPMGRIGTVEEVAAMAAFLCTPAASYVNGVSVRVDGGRTGSI